MGDVIQYLVTAGHSLDSILHYQQPGIPYPGWTIPQVRFWTTKAAALRGEQYADRLTSLNMAIVGSFDDSAHRKLIELVGKLTRQKNETRHVPAGMVSVMVQPKDVDHG